MPENVYTILFTPSKIVERASDNTIHHVLKKTGLSLTRNSNG